MWIGGTLTPAGVAQAGPFTHVPIGASDPAIVAWASEVVSFSLATDASPASDSGNALGPADGGTFSLGDLLASEVAAGEPAGEIVLGFAQPIVDGSGADFAVFENAFDFLEPPDFTDPTGFVFAELAFVEVSSNGVDFARFPTTSLTTEGTGDPSTDLVAPFGRDFAGIDPTNVDGFAGFDRTFEGTPFDLGDLLSDPLVVSGVVDLDDISFVRLVDIPGDGSRLDDSDPANPILDAFSTTSGGEFLTAGFDIDAVGVLNVPEPRMGVVAGAGIWLAWLVAHRRQRSSRRS